MPPDRKFSKPSSPISMLLASSNDQHRSDLERCYVNSDYGTVVINWSNSPLYLYYSSNRKDLKLEQYVQISEWDNHYYTDREIEGLIGQVKTNYNEISNNKDTQGPIYLKALLTLKFLLNE